MGFIVLGIAAMNADATVGAVFQMVAHGVVISALFFLAGVVERRYGTRDLRELSGMLKGAPSYAVVLGLAAFAGMGLPGLIGFWGEFMVLKGTYFNSPRWTTVLVGPMDGSRYLQIVAILAVLGILTAAVYMINMLQRVLPGEMPAKAADEPGAPAPKPWRGFRLTEGLALMPLAAAMVIFGLYPAPIVNSCLEYANQLWTTYLMY
jgi:NADH-quinone oxidoreductase subunit M